MLTRLSAIKRGSILEVMAEKSRALIKNETIAYKGAYLTTVRERLLALHQRGLIDSLDQEEESSILKDIYEEINDLFIDEHWAISNGDMLEQCFHMINPIRKIR